MRKCAHYGGTDCGIGYRVRLRGKWDHRDYELRNYRITCKSEWSADKDHKGRRGPEVK